MLAESWPDIKRTFEGQGYVVIAVETRENSPYKKFMEGGGVPQIAVVSDNDTVIARWDKGFAEAGKVIDVLNDKLNTAQYHASMAAYGASMAAYYNANSY